MDGGHGRPGAGEQQFWAKKQREWCFCVSGARGRSLTVEPLSRSSCQSRIRGAAPASCQENPLIPWLNI